MIYDKIYSFQKSQIQIMGSCLGIRDSVQARSNDFENNIREQPEIDAEDIQFEIKDMDIKWELYQIIEQILKNTCPSSQTVNQLASILMDLVVELNGLDSKKSKEMVDALFDKDTCNQIKASYSDSEQKEKFHYNKLLRMYKKKNKKENISQEEESRIFHNLALNIQKINEYQCAKHYSKELVDEFVQLQCIQNIVQKAGEKFNYEITQIKSETQRMKKMLKQTYQKYGKEIKALKYDLEDKIDYISAAEISKYACQYHENGIYFLIVYFKSCFDMMQSKGKGVYQIQNIMNDVLDILGKQYRPGQTLSNIEQYRKSFTGLQFKKDVKHNKYKLKKENKNAQLESIIIQQAKSAEMLKKHLERLIFLCCLKSSLWSKTNLKINPKNVNKKAMIRVTEKMLFKTSSSNSGEKKHNLQKTLSDVLKQEDQEYKLRISKALEAKQDIQFTISDMLRGKCIFLAIQDILIAISTIKDFISKNKDVYELVEVENRFKLKNPISDFTLKIQITDKRGHSLISELQLSLQSNFAIYNFAHKIYEFVRSKIFSKIKTLSNYLEQYREKMTEMIVNQVQDKKEFDEEKVNQILNYFLISDSQNHFSLHKSLSKQIQVKGQQQFEHFLQRYKFAEPAINMIIYRKLGLIDQNKVQLISKQDSISIRNMQMLQMIKYWNPYNNIEATKDYQKHQKILKQSISLRNKILDSQIKILPLGLLGQYSTMTAEAYGYHSIETANYLFKLALFQQSLGIQQYYQQALNCFQNSEEKNTALQHQCKFRHFACLSKFGKTSGQSRRGLEKLSIAMKQGNNYLYAVAIELLMSEYSLIVERNNKRYSEYYKCAEQMAQVQGIPFSANIINDIEFRIWSYQLEHEEAAERKKQIFTDKLGQIIQNFGSYKSHQQISQQISSHLIVELEILGIQLPFFKPNRFQTTQYLEKLTEHQCKILAKMQYSELFQLFIRDSEIEGDKLCQYLATCQLPKLFLLNLKHNKITDEGLRFFIQINLPSLSMLYLDNNQITEKGVRIIAGTNTKCPKLFELNLKNNRITEEEAKMLAQENWDRLLSLNVGGKIYYLQQKFQLPIFPSFQIDEIVEIME